MAGQDVNVVCEGGLVQIHHRGVLIATHARRHEPAKQQAGMQRQTRSREVHQRPTASVVTVSRKVDSSGNVSFAGANYRVGNAPIPNLRYTTGDEWFVLKAKAAKNRYYADLALHLIHTPTC